MYLAEESCATGELPSGSRHPGPNSAISRCRLHEHHFGQRRKQVAPSTVSPPGGTRTEPESDDQASTTSKYCSLPMLLFPDVVMAKECFHEAYWPILLQGAGTPHHTVFRCFLSGFKVAMGLQRDYGWQAMTAFARGPAGKLGPPHHT